MTTVSSAPTFDMEFLQAEDTMELASTPHMPQDDLDLDLDSMQEPELAPEDSMVEDAFDNGRTQSAEHFHSEEMIDEDTQGQYFPEHASDLDMEAHAENEIALEDEDILYEDDEALKEMEHAQLVNDSTETESEHDHTEEPFEVVPDSLEVEEAQVENELTYTEHADSGTISTQPFVTEVTEELHEQQEPFEVQKTYQEIDDANPEAHTEDQGHEDVIQAQKDNTVESAPNLRESYTNTNLLEPTRTVHGPRFTDQDTMENPDNTAEQAAAEQHLHPQETQAITIHTVKIIYQDSEICLFPPHSDGGTEMFFLSDQSLAHETLDKLLASCRDVLADTIGDDDELVLDVASMGLHISEGSKYAAEITLSQILDVYLTLSHNANIQEIEPLYCNLSSRVCLASQYAYLAAAAQEGKTITEIIAEHMNSPEIELVEDEQDHVEFNGDSAAHYEGTESAVPAPKITAPHNAEPDDDAAPDTEANEITGAHRSTELDGTQTIFEAEAINAEEHTDIAGVDAHEEFQAVNAGAAAEDAEPEDVDVEPNDIEYQEEIDEVSDDYLDETAEETISAGQQQPEAAHSANDETASSGTVQAEVEDYEEHHFEVNPEHDYHLEQIVDGGDQLGNTVAEAQNEQNVQSGKDALKGAEPLQLGDENDDLLDLGLEDQEQPLINELDFAAQVEEEDFQDNDDEENFSADADASTDQTLNHTQGDEAEDDLDVFLPPTTPAKTVSAKRKVDVEDEDDFDLLDIETPDKKRRRPS